MGAFRLGETAREFELAVNDSAEREKVAIDASGLALPRASPVVGTSFRRQLGSTSGIHSGCNSGLSAPPLRGDLTYCNNSSRLPNGSLT